MLTCQQMLGIYPAYKCLHEMFGIYSPFKCLHANKCWVFTLLINVYMPTNVGMLTFMSRIKFMLSSVELENSFITLGADQTALNITINSSSLCF